MDSSPKTLQAWVSPKVEARSSGIEGKGMFVLERIAAGEEIVRWGGTIYSEAEIKAGKANPHSIVALDEGVFLADPVDEPTGIDFYLNHSCTPSLWMKDALTLIAMRDIEIGEEVTVDYGLWECDPEFRIDPCRCGSIHCRGKVTGSDWQSPELQKKYKDHFVPFLNHRIKQLK